MEIVTTDATDGNAMGRRRYCLLPYGMVRLSGKAIARESNPLCGCSCKRLMAEQPADGFTLGLELGVALYQRGLLQACSGAGE